MGLKMTVWAIIPVKRLSEAKSSLREALDHEQRRELVLCMLEDVLSEVKKVESILSVIVSPDEEVLNFTRSKGAKIVLEEDLGLNPALRIAIDKAMEEGAESIIVIPGDVPMLRSEDIEKILAMSSENRNVVITPSEENGTNALLLCPPNVMDLHFGGESFPEHVEEARSCGIIPKIYRSERLERDIDDPSDLLKVETLGIGTRTHDFLKKIEQS